jgi:hypothetical protein
MKQAMDVFLVHSGLLLLEEVNQLPFKCRWEEGCDLNIITTRQKESQNALLWSLKELCNTSPGGRAMVLQAG